MIYYSNNLYDTIIGKIKYLIIGNQYKIVGSFGKNKYVTDIDITNYVHDNINFDKEIKKIVRELPNDILFLNLTSGIRSEFIIPWQIIEDKNKLIITNYEYIESINFINNLYFLKLINANERDYCNNLLKENPTVNDLMLIEDKLYNKSKKKFTKQNILDNNLSNEFMTNDNNIIHYIYEYNNDIIPIDVGIIKKNKVNRQYVNNNSFDKKKYLMFLKKEYYFILGSMRRYLDKKDIDEINKLMNVDYGSYRQILMNIFYLIQLIYFPVLGGDQYYNLCNLVLKKIKNYTTFDDAIIENIKKMLDSHIDILDDKWYNSLRELEDKLTIYLNEQFKDYAYNYYKKIYKKNTMKYDYLAFDINLLK